MGRGIAPKGRWRLRLAASGIVVAVAVVLAASTALRLRSYDSIEHLRADNQAFAGIIEVTERALSSLLRAESAQRGFLLVETPQYLEPYQTAKALALSQLDLLDKAAGEFPWLRDLASQLRGFVQRKTDELDATIALERSGKRDAALALVNSGAGLRLAEEARVAAAQIIARAAAEREQRAALLGEREEQALRGAIAAAVIGSLLLGAVALALLFSRSRIGRTREALALQTSRLSGTVENLREGVAVFDVEDRLLLSNRAFFAITGIPDGLREPGTPFQRFAEAGSGWPGEPFADPGRRTRTDPITVDRGKLVLEVWRGDMPDGGHLVAVSDVSRRAEAEAIARQAQKLEVVGQLTGGVAHDFNNLLQIISSNLDLLGTRIAQGAAQESWLRQRLAAAQAGVERGARLTRHLLAFARRQPLAPEAIDAARLLRGLEDMLRRAIGPDISFELISGAGLWPVIADPHQLENAVLNLAINARDAMPGTGEGRQRRLTIDAANASLDSDYAAAHHEVVAGQYVMVAVTDTGIGMTEEQVGRAVEPFYTTKADGQGTGLGLSMVYGFVKQSGGHFKIYTELGHGTTVKMYLPRAAVSASWAPDGLAQFPDPAEGEVALVVDDDDPVRRAACEALDSLGYGVRGASSAAEALEIMRRASAAGETIDLLFTDVVMPGTPSSRAMAEEARILHPRIAVVFTSGYTENSVVHNGQIDPGVVMIGKPWRIETLAPRLRAALRTAREGSARSERPRALLVEPDALVRMTVGAMLQDLGYDVVATCDATSALRHARDSDAVAVFTEELTDIDAASFAARVRDRSPGIRLIMIEGVAPPGDRGTPQGTLRLARPFDLAAMAAVLAT